MSLPFTITELYEQISLGYVKATAHPHKCKWSRIEDNTPFVEVSICSCGLFRGTRHFTKTSATTYWRTQKEKKQALVWLSKQGW